VGIVGVDLDHCRDAETGTIESWARSIVDRLKSYTEITPSSEGLRIFIRAKLPPQGRKKGNFECYESGRYLTVTGNHLPGTPITIEQRQAEMDAIHSEVFADRNHSRTNGKVTGDFIPSSLDDAELLAKAFNATNGEKIRRLYQGDTSAYSSPSEADQALCNHLAFYAGHDRSG
jgi:putative DNA primase/helicase